MADQPPQPVLPTCSARQPQGQGTTQEMTLSMMQAYTAMRGPAGGQHDDPLFDWIQDRDAALSGGDTASSSATRGLNKYVIYSHSLHISSSVVGSSDTKQVPLTLPSTRVLAQMDRALDSENMGADSPREANFEVPKPEFEHIKPPFGMDMSRYEALDPDKNHPGWGDDSDDEEGAGPSGRISPCTFAEWAKGCQRWDQKGMKDPEGVSSLYPLFYSPLDFKLTNLNKLLKNAVRTRPESSAENADDDKDRFPHYMDEGTRQFDVYTGEEISPTYPVPPSPSVMFTSPGVVGQPNIPASFQTGYNRMAPLPAKGYRDHKYGRAETSATGASTDERYTNVSPRPTPQYTSSANAQQLYVILKT
ncbi:hypothetical protein F4677DRAFT_95215 [Hypoxylon crocopeplum]|nr:hypothetical protein F4677DRAFT_95215 [Hypoxylon crocopeplum]